MIMILTTAKWRQANKDKSSSFWRRQAASRVGVPCCLLHQVIAPAKILGQRSLPADKNASACCQLAKIYQSSMSPKAPE
jgi:hypothetical protein